MAGLDDQRRGKFWRVSVLSLAVAVHSGLVLWGGWANSVTYDEYLHVPVGLAYWDHGALFLYHHNPPLSKWLYGGLAKVAGAKGEPHAPHYSFGDRAADFRVARVFHVSNRERIRFIYFVCRSVNLAFTLSLAYLLFQLVQHVRGAGPATVVTSICLLDPNVIGHATVATPDVLITLLVLLLHAVGLRFVCNPSLSAALLLGLVAGLALGTKFSAIPIAGVWSLVLTARVMSAGRGWRPALHHLLAFLVSLTVVLNGVYVFSGVGARLGDLTFRSRTLCPQAQGAGNIFAQTALGEVVLPVPAEFLLGLDDQQFDFDRRGFEKYLAGEQRGPLAAGWWYYYLVCWLLKTHVAALVLCLVGAAAALVRQRWTLLLLWCGSPAALALTLSLHSTINSHFRYALPCLPFLYLIAGLGWPWSRGWRVAAYGLLVLALAELYLARGAELSYFNVLAGGPARGYQWLADSNVDWGQALPAAADWIAQHAGDEAVYLAHVSPVAPQDYGIMARLEPPRPERAPGFHLISASLLTGLAYGATLTDGSQVAYETGALVHYRQLPPLCVLRGAIYVYHVDENAQIARE